MKSLQIAWKDFKIRIADRRGFLLMFAMPLLLTAILGMALSDSMNGEVSLPTTRVGVVLEGEDELAGEFRDNVLRSAGFNEVIEVTEVKSKHQMREDIQEENLDVGLIFPVGWSEKLTSGELLPTEMYLDPTKELQGHIVETLLSSFQSRALAVSQTSSVIVQDLRDSRAVSTGDIDFSTVINQTIEELESVAASTKSYVTLSTAGNQSITSMQYYAAGMGVMFLLFSSMVGGKSIASERSSHTLGRLMSSPTRKASIMGGKFLGTFFYSIVQFTVFILFTALVLGVHWGSNYWQVAIVAIVYSFTVSGLSLLLASLFQDEKTIDVVATISIQILAIIGGSMLPLAIFPEIIQQASNFTPNKWALSGFLDIMSGTTWTNLLMSLSILTAVGIVSIVISSISLRSR
ncbi:hypothetical protein Q75_02275 [Bacillus coahuilensis p1.1.43]|uniref:ABC transmembrane type-2 domain-containing protein n=1 Tax=Bacillus coahuilensis p1.1.43 TaxID=1150625 RepID=A0A147KBN9_9BACI|nr:ABC transporter permease [Bacillus coahuilensis]KUP08736.1 hypothetical protein Q75_02275 [Bacillus coahuilensis p1.1.43]